MIANLPFNLLPSLITVLNVPNGGVYYFSLTNTKHLFKYSFALGDGSL